MNGENPAQHRAFGAKLFEALETTRKERNLSDEVMRRCYSALANLYPTVRKTTEIKERMKQVSATTYVDEMDSSSVSDQTVVDATTNTATATTTVSSNSLDSDLIHQRIMAELDNLDEICLAQPGKTAANAKTQVADGKSDAKPTTAIDDTVKPSSEPTPKSPAKPEPASVLEQQPEPKQRSNSEPAPTPAPAPKSEPKQQPNPKPSRPQSQPQSQSQPQPQPPKTTNITLPSSPSKIALPQINRTHQNPAPLPKHSTKNHVR